MTKKNAILILLLIMAGLTVIIYITSKENITIETSANVNNKINQVRFDDWLSYQLIIDSSDKELGTGFCAEGEFNDFIIKAGDIYKLVLPGNFELLWTPNYENWSNEKFVAFNDDATAICGAGGRYPLKAYPDRLVWYSGGCGGAIPSEGTQAYDDFQKCEESKAAVEDFFGISN